MADDVILRYLTDLAGASVVNDDDLLHVNQAGADKSLSIQTLLRSVLSSVYPVGKVILMANSQNPNLLFPGTTWKRVAAPGSTIRIASGDADVMATGGNDTMTLTSAQLPAHNHYMSFNSQGWNPGEVLTTPNGQHTHGAGCSTNGDHQHQGGLSAPGAAWGTLRTGTDNTGSYALNWTSINGNHSHTIDVYADGQHSHGVTIPAHNHLIQGYTENSGSGASFSITNRFIKLAAWQRSE